SQDVELRQRQPEFRAERRVERSKDVAMQRQQLQPEPGLNLPEDGNDVLFERCRHRKPSSPRCPMLQGGRSYCGSFTPISGTRIVVNAPDPDGLRPKRQSNTASTPMATAQSRRKSREGLDGLDDPVELLACTVLQCRLSQAARPVGGILAFV